MVLKTDGLNRLICCYMLFICILTATGCKHTAPSSPNDLYDHSLIQIDTLHDNVYRHISMITLSDGSKFPCNGLLYQSGDSVIVFDTPTSVSATEALMEWLDEHNLKVKALVLNHFHEDCTAGLTQMAERNIKVFAHKKTTVLLDTEISINTFDSTQIVKVNEDSIINFYPGWAHSPDNIVSYIPEYQTLFGGCMVKSSGTGKGNLKDADTSQWSVSVGRVIEAFPEVTNVVPGHGSPGGSELLDYTISLFSD